MAGSGTNVVRGLGFTLLLLGPLVVVLDRLDAAGELTLFVLAGVALIPISWLIGEATDNLARYTGPGIGGFLNATFGNAPELIIAIAVLLLIVRVVVTRRALRRQRELYSCPEERHGWTLPTALVVLGVATVVTAFVTETLVGTLRSFAEQAHLSEFFVAVVIVAIIGNSTEHGSAVLLARRGRVKLAVEISLASSAQIAGLLIPLVALISWGFEPLALSFRPSS